MALNFITDFHKQVAEHPKHYCKKTHAVCKMIEKLLKRPNIEYCESDVLAFMEMTKMFRHWKGTTKRIELDIVQKWIVASILGIKIQDKDGEWVRYFKECRIFVAKKFGKSVLMALFALWGLLFDRDRDGAEIYCVATKKSQAEIVLNNCKVYRKQHKDIAKLCAEVYEAGNKFIKCEDNNGFIKALSSSKEGLQGTNSTWCLFDEAQEVKDLTVIEAVRTGMATRKQPMLVAMSTAGVTPESAYHQMYSQIELMCEQKKFDDKTRVFFAVFEIDIDDSIDDKKCWIKANPALLDGRPTLEHLEKEYALAKLGEGEKSLPRFIAFHLNRSCDDAQTYWRTDELKPCAKELKASDYEKMYAWAGVDLAEKTDLCNATVLIVKQSKENPEIFKYTFLQRYFMAKNRLERNSNNDKMAYSSFTKTKSKDEVSQQLLYLSDGEAVNFDDVTRYFTELRDTHGIIFRKIGYDEAMSSQWVFSMQEAGFTVEKRIHNSDGSLSMRDDGQMTKVRQGKYLSPCIRELKALAEAKLIEFDKFNVLAPYCLTNCKVQIDKDNLYSVVKKQSTGRIDGAIGMLVSVQAFNCDKEVWLKDAMPYEDWRNRFSEKDR